MDSFDEIREILRNVAISQQKLTVSLQELATDQKELSISQKETDRLSKETDRKLREVGKQIAGIGEKFGSFTKGLAYPSLRKILFKEYGIDNTVALFTMIFLT